MSRLTDRGSKAAGTACSAQRTKPDRGGPMQPAAYLVDIAETKPDRRNSLSSRCAHRRHRVLHSWGSAMTHYPHIHMIVPGGGISLDGERWVSSRARFLLPVRVLAKLFRRLFLDNLQQLHASGHLQFFGDRICLIERRAFLRHLAPQRKKRWVVCTPSHRSPGRKRCSPICRDTPTASRALPASHPSPGPSCRDPAR